MDKPTFSSSFRRLFLPLLLACTALPAHAAESLATEAQRDFAAGRYNEAKTKFETILASNPKNVAAKNYLKMIAAAEAEAGPGSKSESAFKKLILPKVEIREATLDSTLEYLRQQADKASNGKLKPNFVVQPGVDTSAPVTLRLSEIPFTEALRYVGDLARVRFSFEAYAISVRPKKPATEAPAPSPTPEASQPAPQ